MMLGIIPYFLFALFSIWFCILGAWLVLHFRCIVGSVVQNLVFTITDLVFFLRCFYPLIVLEHLHKKGV